MAFWSRLFGKKSAMPEAQLAALRNRPGWSDWLSPLTLSLYSGAQQDYADIYKTQPAVRIVVDFLAKNIAGLGLHAFERVSTTDRVRITQGPLVEILDHPNPNLTPYRLWRRVVSDVAIYDDAFILKVKNDSGMYLLPLPPKYVQIGGSNMLRPPQFWLYSGAGDREALDPETVIHFHGYNPTDPRRGLSPMETLRRILAEDFAMQEYREFYWKQGARPGGILTRPKSESQDQEWTEQEREAFRTMWEAAFSGALGSGRTAILEDGMEYKPLSFNAQQSQYVDSRKLSREEVAAAYGIAPTLVGILDHATYSNIESQHIQMYQDTLGPWLTMLEQDVELQLVPEFANNAQTYVEFNLAEKLKGSFEEQARAISTLTGGRPLLTGDEGRALFNRPALGGAMAEILVPAYITGATPNPVPADSPPPKGDYHEVARRLVERQREALGGMLGRKGVKVGQVFDSDRWIKEFETDLERIPPATDGAVMASAVKALAEAVVAKPDPVVNVNVGPAPVTVNLPQDRPKRIERDDRGNVLRLVPEPAMKEA